MLNSWKEILDEKKAHLAAIQLLLSKSSFTAKEAAAQGVSSASLAYYIKKGEIKRLRRGIYQGSAYVADPSIFQWEDLIEAVNSIPGGVVCLISALAVYDMTDEIPRQHWIAVTHRTSIKRDEMIKIMRFRNLELGQTQIKIGNAQVPIFDRERTIIDAFRLLGRETAIKALKMGLAKKGSERLDLKKLQTYAKKLRFNIASYLLTATT